MVEVDYSLDVLLCEVSLIDLHWLNSRPVIHQASVSDVAICQCTVKGTNISITGSSSNIILKYSNISSSSGYHPKLPLLSMATLSGFHNFVQILNCNFVKNVGPVLTVENIYQTSIVDSYLEGNKVLAGGSIITGHVSHLKLSGTKFIRNVGHLLFLDDNHSLASLEVSIEVTASFSSYFSSELGAVNPSQPKMVLHTVFLHISYATYNKNLPKNQEHLEFVIISFILTTLMFDSGGVKGMMNQKKSTHFNLFYSMTNNFAFLLVMRNVISAVTWSIRVCFCHLCCCKTFIKCPVITALWTQTAQVICLVEVSNSEVFLSFRLKLLNIYW